MQRSIFFRLILCLSLFLTVSCSAANSTSNENGGDDAATVAQIQRLSKRAIFLPTKDDLSTTLREVEMPSNVVLTTPPLTAESIVEMAFCEAGDYSKLLESGLNENLSNSTFKNLQEIHYAPNFDAIKGGEKSLWYLASFRSIADVDFEVFSKNLKVIENNFFSNSDKRCTFSARVMGDEKRQSEVESAYFPEESVDALPAAHFVQTANNSTSRFARTVSLVPIAETKSIAVLVVLVFNPLVGSLGVVNISQEEMLDLASSISRKMRVSWDLRIRDLIDDVRQ